MKIAKVNYSNFGPFGDAEVDFSVPGLTVIEGQINGVPGCDSNGSGKSFLFDGIAWCLYGRCIRTGYKGDDIIKLDSDGGCYVTVEITGRTNYRVDRYRKHPQHMNDLEVWQKTGKRWKLISRGTTTQTEALVVKLLGMDFDAFCNSVAFGARDDVKSFFLAAEAERKRLMDTFLGLGIYARAEKVARQKSRALSDELEELDRDYESHTRVIKKLQEQVAKIATEDELEAMRIELKRKRAGVVVLRSEMRRRAKAVRGVQQKLDRYRIGYDERYERYETEMDEHARKQSAANRRLRNAEDAMVGLQSDEKGLERQIRIVTERVESGECPTCGRAYTKKDAHDAIHALAGDLSQCQYLQTTTQMEIDIANSELDALVEPEPPSTNTLNKLQDRVDAEQDTVDEVEDSIRIAESRVDQYEFRLDNLSGQAGNLRDEIEELEGKAADCKEQGDALAEKLQMIDFWVEAFSNGGIKSFMIESIVPEINRRATEYAVRMMGAGVKIQLAATTQLKSRKAVREKMSIDVTIPNCAQKYTGASRGQKKRLDLSLLLGFRDVVSKRSGTPFNQFLADELFDSLDRSGYEYVGELLKEIGQEVPVAIITHEEHLKPIADRVVTVVHEKGSASIA